MKKYILVPFKEYKKQQEEQIHHQGRIKEEKRRSWEIQENSSQNRSGDDVDVGVQRSKNSSNKKKQNTNTVQGKKKRQSEEREENTVSQGSFLQGPGSVDTVERLQDEYPSKVTRKFWIRP